MLTSFNMRHARHWCPSWLMSLPLHLNDVAKGAITVWKDASERLRSALRSKGMSES